MRFVATGMLILIVLLAGCLSGNSGESLTPADVGENTVIHNSSGFFPQTLTVEQGTTVTWQSTGSSMWVASDAHPTHTGYSGTSLSEHCGDSSTAAERFDSCDAMDSYSFTFTKTGEWSYHNHLRASQSGTIVVE